MRQLCHTSYGNKVNTDADYEIGLESNDGSKIIFINARRKVIKLTNIHINTMATINMVTTVKIVVTEEAAEEE